MANQERETMHVLRTATVVLLLGALCLATACGPMLIRRNADEIRRQQNGSEAFAKGEDSRKRSKDKGPTRAIVHTATYDAADGLIDGVIDSVSEPKRREQLASLGEGLEQQIDGWTTAAGQGIVKGLNEKLPETERVVVRMVENLRRDLGLDPEKNVQKIMKTAFREVGKGFRTELRPQVKGLVQDDILGSLEGTLGDALGPDLKDRVRENIVPAIQEITKGAPEMTKELASSAAEGFSAGMAKALDSEVDGSLGQALEARLGTARDAVDHWLARGLLVALVLAIIVILIAVFKWLHERNERLEAERVRLAASTEGERRERMLRLVASAIQRAGSQDPMVAFRSEMRRHAEDQAERETVAELNRFLIAEGLKLGKKNAASST